MALLPHKKQAFGISWHANNSTPWRLFCRFSFFLPNLHLYFLHLVHPHRSPTGAVSFGSLRRNSPKYLWGGKLTLFRVEGQSSCALLYVNKPKCYPFNMAGYHDSKGLHLCELLETDKYRTESGKFHDNVMISVLRYYFFIY
ncbi:hypothetical protein pdam_00015185 [Pocillopora damicornis]|uniref:Uncharacterized protein n=1 Tax=Pocillopora damicornis TaxID=46731 RepID=A0A3M6UEK5_POCDA|nr:hypothetical protein pdam_00015185 [Pocillopora damicornis]